MLVRIKHNIFTKSFYKLKVDYFREKLCTYIQQFNYVQIKYENFCEIDV